MLGNEINPPMLYVLDTSTLSQAFRAFDPDIFVSFWEHFNSFVRDGGAVSVRQVRLELANAPWPAVAQSPLRLESFNRDFFSDPTEQEQQIVREMTNDPALSAAANRWRSKGGENDEDADPYLIARARASVLPITIVTEESSNNRRTSTIPAVCRHFRLPCTNLDGMLAELGWRF